MKRIYTFIVPALLSLTQVATAEVLSTKEFATPAHCYKPSTWMHAMSGNMSKAGLTKDLESISNVGIGGVLLFNISQRIPYGDVKYASPEHIEMMRHAAKECERLGLSFGFHNCDGWSSSGGPWITPEESMKMVVSRQIVTKGGKISMTLPTPTKRAGYYEDIALFAYPASDGDKSDATSQIVGVSSSCSSFDTRVITDLTADVKSELTAKPKERPTITLDYGKSEDMQSIVVTSLGGVKEIKLYTSNDGKNFDFVTKLKAYRTAKMESQFAANFKPQNARYYRVEFDKATSVSDVALSHSRKFEHYISKCLLSRTEDELLRPTDAKSSFPIIKREEMIDLTLYLDKDGQLRAKLPRGEWTILRIGCTTTEAFNHPASDAGRGLECDKFSATSIEKHFDNFSRRVIESAKDVAPNALQYVEIDSYEMGGQNWTKSLPAEFRRRKGYDMMKYLPLLVGKCIDSNEVSDAMLADFRDVCCDLMQENYFDHFGELCHKNGLKYYLEPYGNGAMNSLDISKRCDIPMCEFWMDKDYLIGRSAISGAHIYGKNVISAESFTAASKINWRGHPAMTKLAGDRAWKWGVNEFMFHRFVHQANTHVMPGMTMGFWGFHFDRTQTWWNTAGREWFRYISRGSYLLRKGVPVSDLLVFVGDGSPASGMNDDYGTFKYDFVNADVLINRTKVVDGEIVLPEGTTYKILYLRNTKDMEKPTLRRLAEIIDAGVPVIGDLPTSLMGMQNLTESKSKMKELVERLRKSSNYYPTADLSSIGKKLGITPDFELIGATKGDAASEFFHRQIQGDEVADIYFVSNPSATERRTLKCAFRVTGRVPELWHALDGKCEVSNNWSMSDKQTTLDIELDPNESAFLVFREPTAVRSKNEKTTDRAIAQSDISNDWSVKFDKFYGYDATVPFEKLHDWAKSDNEEVKYYSGGAVYSKSIEIDADMLSRADEVILDLGKVEVVAAIKVNGQEVCTDWIAPFRNDIRSYLKAGENKLEINVVNLWPNRLIGDERHPDQGGGFKQDMNQHPQSKMPRWYVENKPMPEGKRITFTTMRFYKKTTPLVPSGMIGPAKIVYIESERVE